MTNCGQVGIIGGGAFGLSAALALVQRGYHVTIYETSQPPVINAASTDINKLFRIDHGDDNLLKNLAIKALHLIPKQFFQSSGLLLMSSSEKLDGFEKASFENLSLTHPQDLIQVPSTEDELIKMFPPWKTAIEKGLFHCGYLSKSAGILNSTSIIHYLRQEVEKAGVTFRYGTVQHVGLSSTDGHIQIIRENNELEELAHPVLLCPGAGISKLLPEIEPFIEATAQPVIFLKVPSHLSKKYSLPNFVPFTANIMTEGYYGFPANEEGIVKIANTNFGYKSDRHSLGINDPIPEVEVYAFKTFLQKWAPELADLSLHSSRLCYYTRSVTNDFIISPVPGKKDLFVATGCNGQGMKFVPAIGEIIADMICGIPNVYLDRFSFPKGEIDLTWKNTFKDLPTPAPNATALWASL